MVPRGRRSSRVCAARRAFPREVPHGVSDGALSEIIVSQMVRRVKLRGAALARYLFQEIRLNHDGESGPCADTKLANYANLHVFFGSFTRSGCYEHMLQNGSPWPPSGSRLPARLARCVAEGIEGYAILFPSGRFVSAR